MILAFSAVSAQPFVSPQFLNAPNTHGTTEPSPTGLSRARIAGVVTVVVLFSALFILGVVICTYKPKEKELDLEKPLILDVESKKKKKKSKKGEADPSQSVELEAVAGGSPNNGINEIPSKVQPADMDVDSNSDSETESEESSKEASAQASTDYSTDDVLGTIRDADRKMSKLVESIEEELSAVEEEDITEGKLKGLEAKLSEAKSAYSVFVKAFKANTDGDGDWKAKHQEKGKKHKVAMDSITQRLIEFREKSSS